MPVELLGKSIDELRGYVASLGEAPYRAKQIYRALYAERRFDFAAMTNLPAALRARLAAEARISLPRVVRRFASADGSVRFLMALEADAGRAAQIETVFMPADGRQTICISTQAGCAVDCHFCLTAQLGLIRNLSAGEIVGQALVALAEHGEAALAPRTNVVLMGQGEPLLNYEAVMAAVRIMLDAEGMGISPRHVTLSTSGIVPGIERLAREAVMPINRKYPLARLLEACREYPLRTWESLTFEYVLLGGVNDAPEDARRVARLVSDLRAKVNLIPWNPGALAYRAPEAARVEEFRRVLVAKGVPAFVRLSRGQDVFAACGQLALVETATALPVLPSH